VKKLSLTQIIILIVNVPLALLTLLSFLSYYVAPERFVFIAFISLFIPLLILLNILFVVYWVFHLKKYVLLSLFVLLVGFKYISNLYQFEGKEVLLTDDIKIMSYNVRMFNLYQWIDDTATSQHIYDFINQKKPDILCIQEFQPSPDIDFHYPFKYVELSEQNRQFGHAIFSKYRIINSGSLNFNNSGNNAIYADILVNEDTVRVYNVHLESLKINPSEETLTQDNSERFKKRIEAAFLKQASQVRKITDHEAGVPYHAIICGDFNNTSFSWSYKQLLGDKTDAFKVAGKGFGRTFDFTWPLRIDFILLDKSIEINHFDTYQIDYSDHYPIMANINFSSN
jgi:endonuclease/exonuclease/phosphatase family metal-dependent hydrolase